MNIDCNAPRTDCNAHSGGVGTMYERKLTEREREYVLREAADELRVRLYSSVSTPTHTSANAAVGQGMVPYPPAYHDYINEPDTDVRALDREAPLAHLTELVRRYIPRQNLFSEWNEFFAATGADPLPARNERKVLVASSGNQWTFEGMTAMYVVPTKTHEFADWLLRLTFSAERAGPCPHPSNTPQRISWPMAEELV